MKQLALPISPPFVPTLANFVAGRNGELLATLRALAAGRGEPFVYLWGEPGSGRTHLLRAWAAALPGARYLPPPWDGLDILRAPCAAAVDDVDALPDPGQVALFNLCNRIREAGGTLLTAGPCPPAQLALRPEVATRLAAGLVYRVQGLSDEEKATALREHARHKGITLHEELAAYLLARSRRDLPSLLALLDELDRLSLELRRPLTAALAREALQGRLDL